MGSDGFESRRLNFSRSDGFGSDRFWLENFPTKGTTLGIFDTPQSLKKALTRLTSHLKSGSSITRWGTFGVFPKGSSEPGAFLSCANPTGTWSLRPTSSCLASARFAMRSMSFDAAIGSRLSRIGSKPIGPFLESALDCNSCWT